MIPGKSLDNFSELLSLGLFNNLISFQDTPVLINEFNEQYEQIKSEYQILSLKSKKSL